ncbi:unnamed protein product [Paramecium octaurelia]|uniref:Protein kinase domain-containing protein n=1 Tax=Paramecium octaurelia TaxID=43137 RepID=A0A8S1VJC4_PAROT|nr:unnamed protein product [Paramecium octaurelia]
MKCIGNYQLGKTIGSGTFGKVKLAVHIPTQQTVAIKIMNKSRMVDIVDIERVQRELHILKIVRHPNIIMLYEVFETTKYIFIVMEYCQKELFSYIVKNKKIPEVNACALFQQLLSGIEYIHKLKIVHRDIKPENLLIKGRIKIVDFGLSNTYDDLLKTACGSPCYAAPEMISGKLYSGLKADIWSSGVVLFVMLCGYLPFEDANTNQLYKKILSANYKVPNFLSSDAVDVLKLILNPDPEDRPNIDQIRKHPWFNLYKTSFQIKQGILIGQHKIPIDNNVVSKVEQLGYTKKYIYQCLISNQHNDATTAYYLFLDQIIQSGGQTCADIASDQFQAQLIELNSQTAKSEIKINMTIEDEKQDTMTMNNTTSINSQQIQQQPQMTPKNLSSRRSNKTERYPMFDRLMNKIEKMPSNIRSESEQQKTLENTKNECQSNKGSKSISLSDYYSDKLNKELPLPTIHQQLKRKKPKIRTNLLTIQQVYGVRK